MKTGIDPLDKKIVMDQETQAILRAQQRKKRLLMNPNNVREALWKPEKTDQEQLKQELLTHKASLGDVKRQEREFLVELKEKIGNRYNKLKLSFEREYLMHVNDKKDDGAGGEEELEPICESKADQDNSQSVKKKRMVS